MSIVMHKYTPEEIPEAEMVKTFAARQHTLEFLVDALRKQTTAGTLSSYLITGPRGAGKSLLLRMLRIRIREDAGLKDAWLVVRFPEEQFNVASVRDLLAATLKLLSEEKVPLAGNWLARVEAESDDEQSEELAVSGLREISRRQGRRFILFVENLDEFFDHAISDNMKGTLRRLLMTDPFMLIIGSAVHVFESLKRYDEAFFNYFTVVRLERLNEKEVYELLQKRAEFDGNEQFLRKFPRLKPKIRAMTHLSGGNPRLILMLYELLSQKHVTTLVQELRRLVDELTPLLKHEMEDLPPQQQKIIHALMEKGGTATPADLTTPTRLPLNTVTAQLRRLKEAQILDLRRGGKGRAAYYTTPDQLFSIWYQMRFLNQRRRQIEMFVEVIRIWFEEEERLRTLNSLIEGCETAAPHAVRESATTAEYFAASLAGTQHEGEARDLSVRQWLKAQDIREAALACAEFSGLRLHDEHEHETQAYVKLGEWCLDRGDPKAALPALEAAAKQTEDPGIMLEYGIVLGMTGDHPHAITIFDAVVSKNPRDVNAVASALTNRGVSKEKQGDLTQAIEDYSTVATLADAPQYVVATALINRGYARQSQGDTAGGIADYSLAIGLSEATPNDLVRALMARGDAFSEQGDTAQAIGDYTSVIELPHATSEQAGRALMRRGFVREGWGDQGGAIADYTSAIELPHATSEGTGRALVRRGILIARGGNPEPAIHDFEQALALHGVSTFVVGWALSCRGLARFQAGNIDGAFDDWLKALEITNDTGGRRLTTAQVAYQTSWAVQRHDVADLVLGKMDEVLATLNVPARIESLTSWLADLARPNQSKRWVAAWKHLEQHQPEEVLESLSVFAPVSEVLENGDRSVLDPLPPERREFAEQVLAKFEPGKAKNDGSAGKS